MVARGSWRSKERESREAYPGLLQASVKDKKWKTGVSNIVHPSSVHQRETEADVLVTTRSVYSWNIPYASIPPEASTGSLPGSKFKNLASKFCPSIFRSHGYPVFTSKLGKHAGVNSWQIIQQNSSIKYVREEIVLRV